MEYNRSIERGGGGGGSCFGILALFFVEMLFQDKFLGSTPAPTKKIVNNVAGKGERG